MIVVSVNVNPSNCECECGKRNCRRKVVDKLFEEYTENIDEFEMAEITLAQYENMCKCSCALYIALFAVLLTMKFGNDTIFVYYKYMNHGIYVIAKEGSIFQTTIYKT